GFAPVGKAPGHSNPSLSSAGRLEGGCWMVAVLIAAALAAAAPVAPALPAPAVTDGPAMFVVRDADTTIYIFGTFHALDGNADWFNANVRSAFESSSELVLETVIPEGP